MPVSQWQWVTLAEGFPPSLVTNRPATNLKPNETPSATGISATDEGYIKGGLIPSGSARVAKTFTIGGTTYTQHYNRLWAISTTSLVYGAPRYTATYYRQNSGEYPFLHDSGNILAFLPIGETGLILFKTTGAFIIPNANDQDGNFAAPDFVQEAKIEDATHVTELDGVVYFCNNSGLFSVKIDGTVEEISEPIRGDVTAAALTTDYANKFIIVGTTLAYDVPRKRWLAYSSSDFTYQTPRLRASEQTTPLVVQQVGFDITWASGTAAGTLVQLTFSTQVEDRGWTQNQDIPIQYEREQQVRVQAMIQERDTGREFALKIVTLPTEISIRRIAVYAQGLAAESRDS